MKGTAELPNVRDLNSGELVSIRDPESFQLQTVLINTAYYLYCGKEYRFLLSQAREAGLDIDVKKAA